MAASSTNKDMLQNYVKDVIRKELNIDALRKEAGLDDLSDEDLGLVVQAIIRAVEVTSVSPLSGRYAEQTRVLESVSSERALIATRTEIEGAYLVELSRVGVVRPLTEEETKFLSQVGDTIGIAGALQVKDHEKVTNHDVNAMTLHLKDRLKGTTLADLVEYVHFGLTSEDVNNTSYRLLLARAIEGVMIPGLDEVIVTLMKKAEEYKGIAMLSRTHGQAAVPTTLGKEFANFAMRLEKELHRLETTRLTGKLNGAVGNYNALALAYPDVDWLSFSEVFIEGLGLEPNLYTTQINPFEDMIEAFQILERINGILLDLDQDMWRYISDGWLVQEVKAGEVGSSTMPNKVNPIKFENSEGNIGVANALLHMFVQELSVSRLQRDLSDSTVVRNVGSALAFSHLSYRNTLGGLKSIRPNTELIRQDLNKDWAILTEAAQLLMRQAGVPDAYDKVKALSRGMHISAEKWAEWVSQLDVPDEVREQLAALTPESYIGNVAELTEEAIAELKDARD